MPTKERPSYCTNEMLEFLDGLRESGVTNMFGAATYIDAAFPELEDEEEGRKQFGRTKAAAKVLTYWMDSFTERHANAQG